MAPCTCKLTKKITEVLIIFIAFHLRNMNPHRIPFIPKIITNTGYINLYSWMGGGYNINLINVHVQLSLTLIKKNTSAFMSIFLSWSIHFVQYFCPMQARLTSRSVKRLYEQCNMTYILVIVFEMNICANYLHDCDNKQGD